MTSEIFTAVECPIGREIMHDPVFVINSDGNLCDRVGHVFDRRNIVEYWRSVEDDRCPTCRRNIEAIRPVQEGEANDLLRRIRVAGGDATGTPVSENLQRRRANEGILTRQEVRQEVLNDDVGLRPFFHARTPEEIAEVARRALEELEFEEIARNDSQEGTSDETIEQRAFIQPDNNPSNTTPVENVDVFSNPSPCEIIIYAAKVVIILIALFFSIRRINQILFKGI